MILKLVRPTDPVLKAKCETFNFESPQVDPHQLYTDLKETMIALKGVGLSACQVGLPYRVFVVGDYTNADDVIPMFNPRIVNTEGENVLIEEGCLSYPGLFIKIKRPEIIRIRYTDVNGDTKTSVFDGIPSRVIQHEYDHMDGILFHSRANKYHLDFAQRQKVKLDRMRQKNIKQRVAR